MTPTLYVLVGMTASGKSTYARNAAHRGQVIVNDDAIVTMVHGGDYRLYDKKLKPLYKSTENHLVATALAMGRSVVVDRGVNVALASRKRWLALGAAFDVPCVAVHIPREDAATHAWRRFTADARETSYAEWLRIAERHAAIWATPTLEEGFRVVFDFTFPMIRDGGVAAYEAPRFPKYVEEVSA